MSNKLYYRNIFVKDDNVSLSDISGDYPSLEMYDLNGIGEPPKTLDTIDISSLSFSLQPEVSNSLNLNDKDISNVDHLNVVNRLVKNIKIKFNRDISLNHLEFLNFNNEPLKYSLYTNDGNSYNRYNTQDVSYTNINIRFHDICSNDLYIRFKDTIQIPTYIKFNRHKNDNIFKVDNNNINPSSILKEKIEENFNWNSASWKDISINSNNRFYDISGINRLLYNSKNIQGRRLFSYPPITVSNLNYPYFTINFKYHGYDNDDNIVNDISIVDISTARVRIGDVSLNTYLTKNIYIKIDSSLLSYLNINSNNIDLSSNSKNEKAIKLPINTDVSFNFLFKPYKSLNTEIYYNINEVSNNYSFYTNITNINDKLPLRDACNNLIPDASYSLTDLCANYIIFDKTANIVNYLNKPIISHTVSGFEYDIDYVICDNLDASYVSCNNINIDDLCNNSIIANRIILNDSDISNLLIDETKPYNIQKIKINNSKTINNNLISNNCYLHDGSCNNLNILNDLVINNNTSSINSKLSSDISFVNLITYNNKDLINFDNINKILTFGISSENIEFDVPVNIDISGEFNILKQSNSLSNAAFSSARITTRYSGIINTMEPTNLFITSDDRLKHNEYDISNALITINKIKCKKYIKSDNIYNVNNLDINNLPENSYWDSGYIAQDILNIPDLSYVVNNHNNLISINYFALQPYLVKCLQELNTIINNQQKEINLLENELYLLENIS